MRLWAMWNRLKNKANKTQQSSIVNHGIFCHLWRCIWHTPHKKQPISFIDNTKHKHGKIPQMNTNAMSEFVAVKQSQFIAQYESDWQYFDDLTNQDSLTADEQYQFADLYRQICQQYALACQRHYSPMLIASLHKRVMTGHNRIYRQKKGYAGKFVVFVLYEFPTAVRQHARLFWLSFALFYLPSFLFGLLCYFNHELIYSLMDYSQVARMEEMYNPTNEHFGRDSQRASDTDVMMFGHYVMNNISIDFKVYAAGLLFGLGTIFVTMYNGVIIGAVSGHLTQVGFGQPFWQFVVGHGSFELTAIVISCMAGLKLATPLISPVPYSRKDAFKVAGKQSITLILGAGLMTFIAAFIEAFWSSSSLIPPMVKYLVAFGLWVFVGWYLMFCGREKKV